MYWFDWLIRILILISVSISIALIVFTIAMISALKVKLGG